MTNNRRLGKDSFGKKGTNPPKPSFATTTVKFATSKVQRPGFFSSLVPHPLSLCTVLELAVMQIN